jgi:hypothetical protein
VRRAAAAVALALLAALPAAARSDPRAAVVELEWLTPGGYDRCAGVVTARRPRGVVAWTAGQCALQPY